MWSHNELCKVDCFTVVSVKDVEEVVSLLLRAVVLADASLDELRLGHLSGGVRRHEVCVLLSHLVNWVSHHALCFVSHPTSSSNTPSLRASRSANRVSSSIPKLLCRSDLSDLINDKQNPIWSLHQTKGPSITVNFKLLFSLFTLDCCPC